MLDDGHSNSKIKQRNNIDSISMAICFCHMYYNKPWGTEWKGE